jgi:hypothetical protein
VKSFHSTKPNWIIVKQLIGGCAIRVREHLDSGGSGYLMSFLFNRLGGSEKEMNRLMKSEIEGVYASLLTRLIRRPHSPGVIKPVLIASPDWPVYKKRKTLLSEITTNNGLHHHGILLVAPVDRHYRLKIPVEQHFADQQDYYTRDQNLRSVEARRFPAEDAGVVTDYALKGLKANRLPDDETLLILPTTYRMRRSYIGSDQ